MNIEDVRKIVEEEMTKSIMKNLDSSIIFKYISNLENELKLKDDQIEYVKNEYGRTIEEKDKVINEMAKEIDKLSDEMQRYDEDRTILECCEKNKMCETNGDIDCANCIIEYFTNKVEREGK